MTNSKEYYLKLTFTDEITLIEFMNDLRLDVSILDIKDKLIKIIKAIAKGGNYTSHLPIIGSKHYPIFNDGHYKMLMDINLGPGTLDDIILQKLELRCAPMSAVIHQDDIEEGFDHFIYISPLDTLVEHRHSK